MKKSFSLYTGFIFILGLIVSAAAADSPSAVMLLVQKCGSENETRAFMTKGTVAAMDEIKKLALYPQNDTSQYQQKDKWDVVEEKINGDSATVTIRYTESVEERKIGQTVTMKMKKEDGSWKIDLEEELQLALQLMKELKEGQKKEKRLR